MCGARTAPGAAAEGAFDAHRQRPLLAATTIIIIATDGLGGEVSSNPSLSVAPVAGEDLVKHCLQRQVAFAAAALRAAALRKFIEDYHLHLYCCLLLFIASMHCTLLVFIATYCYPVVQI